jgi:hypothetical protein
MMVARESPLASWGCRSKDAETSWLPLDLVVGRRYDLVVMGVRRSTKSSRPRTFHRARLFAPLLFGVLLGLLFGVGSSRDATGATQCVTALDCPPGLGCRNGRCVEVAVVCAARCVTRSDESTCSRFGDDFCGPDARCDSRCRTRSSDGTCSFWHEDACGPETRCASPCRWRTELASCRGFDADVCGPRMQCVPRCSSRRPDGTCSIFASDFCGPHAVCAPNCLGRHDDGQCRRYGADLCESG